MSTELEQRLRVALHEDARQARLVNPDGPVEPPAAQRRPTRTAGWLVAAAVLVVAGVVGALLLRDGGEGDRRVTTSTNQTNGTIVTGDGDGWPSGAVAPDRPDGRGLDPDLWDAFDAGSGSFLYTGVGRIWVLDRDGDEVADFSCGPPGCPGNVVFGPGAEEVTGLAVDDLQGSELPQRLRVTAWDGTARDTIDISALFTRDPNGTPEQSFGAMAWSPDGTRLAVATAPGEGCDPSQDPCAAKVWTLDRHGQDARVVYSAPTDDRVAPGNWRAPKIGDLAWSPDGRSLGVVVAPQPLGDPAWPRLVVLRLPPDGSVRADTLYDYASMRPADSYLMQMWYDETFPFAWSPDGTRIAVADRSGVVEISADDGQVVARHPGVGVDDEGHSHDLAWLPEE